MIYTAPSLAEADRHVLAEIESLRDELRYYLAEPRRWLGTLRRVTVARMVGGSNSIEGYHASDEDAAAIIDDDKPAEASSATRAAILGYRDAMTYMLQVAPAQADISLLKAMHFMMTKDDLSKNPGQWRPGAAWVSDSQGNTVYEAPARDELEPLIDEMLEQISSSSLPPMVTAAMAHLNLTLIHPFSDGNGRMARCLQSLVLASEGLISPVWSSIEEYLGRNTADYYRALEETAAGVWSPWRETRPWIEFCLTAHYRQAVILRQRIDDFEALWDRCEQAAARCRLPSRAVGALTDSARGWRLTRSVYAKVVQSSVGDKISAAMATRDLAAMTAAGLLLPVGEKRGRYYKPSPELSAVWQQVREMRPPPFRVDPYKKARKALSG